MDGAARHIIDKLSGEHCSPENSGSASTNTSAATGVYRKSKTSIQFWKTRYSSLL